MNEAIQRVMDKVISLESEIVPLEKTYGRILAEPVVATHDVPPFHRSPYDGYAIRSADSKGASGKNRISFNVIDEIGAGYVSNFALNEREAIRIMTGAPLPKNADAVVMFEQTKSDHQSFTIRKPFTPYENVSLKGEDAKQGEELIPSGSFIQPGVVALLATFGYANVKVAKRPVVGILSTGTELLEVHEPLVPGKIRNSNGPMIASQLEHMGIESRSYGLEADDLDACLKTIKQAMDETDCLITTGGVSVGDYDYLPQIYEALKAEVLFNKVAMRPGSVTTVAFSKNKFLFGLSGNPSACFTGFELFVRPALLKMMGASKVYLPYVKARLGDDFKEPNPFTRFIRAIFEMSSSGAVAVPAGFNKSNAVSSIARGNAFIVLPGGTREFKVGDEVDVLLLGVDEGVETWQL